MLQPRIEHVFYPAKLLGEELVLNAETLRKMHYEYADEPRVKYHRHANSEVELSTGHCGWSVPCLDYLTTPTPKPSYADPPPRSLSRSSSR